MQTIDHLVSLKSDRVLSTKRTHSLHVEGFLGNRTKCTSGFFDVFLVHPPTTQDAGILPSTQDTFVKLDKNQNSFDAARHHTQIKRVLFVYIKLTPNDDVLYQNHEVRRQRQKCFKFFKTVRFGPNFLIDNYEKFRGAKISKLQLNDKRTHYEQV